MRIPFRPVLEADEVKEAARDLLPLGLAHPSQAQPKCHVLLRCHVRKEAVGLKDHAYITAARRQLSDLGATNDDLALIEPLQPGDGPKRRRFPAAGGTEQRDQFAGADIEPEIVQRANLPVLPAKIEELDRHAPDGLVVPGLT
jgi:hypothetical protein